MLYFFGDAIPPAMKKTDKRIAISPRGRGIPISFTVITDITVFIYKVYQLQCA